MEMNWGLRYSLDVENLECPICTEPLSTPVYQCENGHMLCSTCCKKLTKGPTWSRTCSCPSCSQPTGRIRCLGMEKIIESLQVSCKHSPYGCTEMLYYNKRAEREQHENETCKHKPFPCPHPSCWHVGPSSALPSHLAEVHGVRRVSLKFLVAASEDFVMVEVENHLLLLVHREQDENGDRFFCTTISGDCNVYNLKVKRRAGSLSTFAMETSAPIIGKSGGKSWSAKECLFVPVVDVSHPREYDVEKFESATILATCSSLKTESTMCEHSERVQELVLDDQQNLTANEGRARNNAILMTEKTSLDTLACRPCVAQISPSNLICNSLHLWVLEWVVTKALHMTLYTTI